MAKAKLREGEEFEWLEDEGRQLLKGEVWPRPPKRRRGGDSGAGAGSVVISPSSIAIFDNVNPGTLLATISVVGGSGTYTFTLTDPSGLFTIVGNQLLTATTVIAGMFPITISASNGLGDNPSLNTTVMVSHFSAYTPTYYIYGF